MTEPTPRYDVMIVATNPGYRAADGTLRSLVSTLAFRGFAKPVDEALHKEWLEIYFEPGPAASEVFHKTAYEGPQPVFHEAMLRASDEAFAPEYGPTSQSFHLMLEFRGCVFKEPLGPFRKLLLEAVHIRPKVYFRPHESLPPHKTVNEEDQPEDPRKKKRERGPGLAGTEVDEW